MAARSEPRTGPGMRRERRRARDDESGISTVEVVLLSPLLFLFIAAMVTLGLYADDVGLVQGAAQDAARMASLQRGSGSAYGQALDMAENDLAGTCNGSSDGEPQVDDPLQLSGTAPVDTALPGHETASVDLLKVTVVCNVKLLGFSYQITESSYAPVDMYRGGQP
jgi:Flp pilus assembly protein TadG